MHAASRLCIFKPEKSGCVRIWEDATFGEVVDSSASTHQQTWGRRERERGKYGEGKKLSFICWKCKLGSSRSANWRYLEMQSSVGRENCEYVRARGQQLRLRVCMTWKKRKSGTPDNLRERGKKVGGDLAIGKRVQ